MASIFSGKAGRNASVMTNQLASQNLQQTQPLLDRMYGAQKDQLGGAYRSSRGYLQSGYRDASGMLQQGMDTARGDISTNYGQAAEDLRAGYGQAIDQWQPFYDQSMAGYGMYQNALGLGGAGGTAAAQDAFKTGPGYQWNVDQATGQAARAANRYGGLYSGNTNEAMGRLASNLANQEYGNWIKNLSGFQGAAQSASGAMADIYGKQGAGLADIGMKQGSELAAIAERGGKYQSDLRYGYGTDQASLRTNYGTSMANAAGGYYGSSVNNINRLYDTIIPSTQQGMLAGQQAAGNRFGAIMGGLQLGSQMLGGGAGKGVFGGKLWGG